MSVTVNRAGFSRDAYKGAATTLCAGCGHNSITNHMIKALYELGLEPHKLAKMSGIGCSSKTPAYFVESAHGFNGVHGRMPSLTTGAQLANRELIMLGVSGDGDTASIGLGQFMHMIRRNIDCTYIIEDNGTYGLTKGQFSATADLGSVQKKGSVNTFQPIDPCAVALALGCSFVARSFSGDGKLGEDHDPRDRQAAQRVIDEARAEGHLVTGLLYVDPTAEDFASTEKIPAAPLKDLAEKDLRLSPEQFDQFIAEFA